MRRLIHLMLSPSCRLARLMVGEKRVACDPVLTDEVADLFNLLTGFGNATGFRDVLVVTFRREDA